MKHGKRGTRAVPGVLAAALLVVAASCGGGPFDDIAITAVELSQAPKLEFLRARVGMKFLEVRFEFENRGEEPLDVKALDFSLRDTGGTLYAFNAQVLDMGQPRGQVKAEVPPGATVPGAVVFQIPRDAQPRELIYRQELEGGLSVRL